MRMTNTQRGRLMATGGAAGLFVLIPAFIWTLFHIMRGAWWLTRAAYRGGRHVLARRRATRAAQ